MWWRLLIHKIFGVHITELRVCDDYYLRFVRMRYKRGYKQPYVNYLGTRQWLLPNGLIAGSDYCYEHYPITFKLPNARQRHELAEWSDKRKGIDQHDCTT